MEDQKTKDGKKKAATKTLMRVKTIKPQPSTGTRATQKGGRKVVAQRAVVS